MLRVSLSSTLLSVHASRPTSDADVCSDVWRAHKLGRAMLGRTG